MSRPPSTRSASRRHPQPEGWRRQDPSRGTGLAPPGRRAVRPGRRPRPPGVGDLGPRSRGNGGAWPMSWPAALDEAIVPSALVDDALVPGGPAASRREPRRRPPWPPCPRSATTSPRLPATLGGDARRSAPATRCLVDPRRSACAACAPTPSTGWEGANPDLDLCGVVVNRCRRCRSRPRRIDELGRIVGRRRCRKPAIPQRVIVNQALGERRPIHEAAGSRWRRPRLRRPLDQAAAFGVEAQPILRSATRSAEPQSTRLGGTSTGASPCRRT